MIETKETNGFWEGYDKGYEFGYRLGRSQANDEVYGEARIWAFFTGCLLGGIAIFFLVNLLSF